MHRPGVTLVVTSCQRFDLLEQTLASFFAFNDAPLARAIVVEDSHDGTGVERVVRKFPAQPIDVMVNGARIGQHRSIDRAYATVDTEYIFHCEDDWEFGRSGIIRESIDVLATKADVVLVLARDFNTRYMRSLKQRIAGEARYRELRPNFHHRWYSFTFNPGLRRLSDYRKLPGGYAGFASEEALSLHYKRAGWSMAVLDDARVRHLGDERSTTPKSAHKERLYRMLVERPFLMMPRRVRHYARQLGLSDD